VVFTASPVRPLPSRHAPVVLDSAANAQATIDAALLSHDQPGCALDRHVGADRALPDAMWLSLAWDQSLLSVTVQALSRRGWRIEHSEFGSATPGQDSRVYLLAAPQVR
jgi:hypothetical protein